MGQKKKKRRRNLPLQYLEQRSVLGYCKQEIQFYLWCQTSGHNHDFYYHQVQSLLVQMYHLLPHLFSEVFSHENFFYSRSLATILLLYHLDKYIIHYFKVITLTPNLCVCVCVCVCVHAFVHLKAHNHLFWPIF